MNAFNGIVFLLLFVIPVYVGNTSGAGGLFFWMTSLVPWLYLAAVFQNPQNKP